MKKGIKLVGTIAFFAGIPLAVLMAVLNFFGLLTLAITASILAVAGVGIGLVNIQKKETSGILIASIALIAVGLMGSISAVPFLGGVLTIILEHIAIVVTPVALIVAVKVAYEGTKHP